MTEFSTGESEISVTVLFHVKNLVIVNSSHIRVSFYICYFIFSDALIHLSDMLPHLLPAHLVLVLGNNLPYSKRNLSYCKSRVAFLPSLHTFCLPSRLPHCRCLKF